MTTASSPLVLDLPFKGTRDYLHGTDMLAAISAAAGPGKVNFRIHKVVRSALELLLDAAQSDLSACSAVASVSDRMIGLRETTAAVTRRVPYDEEAAINGADRDDDDLSCPRQTGFTLIEQIVALNKAALAFRKPHVDRWVFTELDLDQYPAEVQKITISPGVSLGDRLVRSAVLFDGTAVGKIGFSKMQD